MTFAIKDIPTGQLNALVKNLMRQMGVSDPVEAIRRLNADEWVVKKAELPAFPAWKTVTVGNLGNAETTRQQLKAAGIKIDNWGDDILGRATFEDTKVTLDLVRVSVEELGLNRCTSTAKIYATAAHHGLSLCPAEVAPQLWLQYPDLLSRDEWLRIAMEPIEDSAEIPGIFLLGYDEMNRSLYGDFYMSELRMRFASSYIFVRSRRKVK